MAGSSQQRDIKRAQKEKQLSRELSNMLLKIQQDDPSVQGLYINKLRLSPDRSMCTVYFAAAGNKEEFDKKLPFLILYKPSLRTGLAKALNARYTPDLVFAYDTVSEKQKRIESLLTKISVEKMHTDSDLDTDNDTNEDS